jgi:hypothetical protein
VTPAEFGTVASMSAFHSMTTSRSPATGAGEPASAADESAPAAHTAAIVFLNMIFLPEV